MLATVRRYCRGRALGAPKCQLTVKFWKKGEFESEKSQRIDLKLSVWRRARGSRQTEKISARTGRCALGLGWKALAPPFPYAWAAEEAISK